jgi:hypothetical protein
MVLCALPEAKVTQRNRSRSVRMFLGPALSVSTLSTLYLPYSADMSRSGGGFFIAVVLIATAFKTFSAEQKWAGEYADKNFLNGQAVFEMSINQSGNAIQISFDAAYADAHGAAPDAEGQAKITGKNSLAFNWEDSFHNSGTGTITRAGDGIVVSMKATHVVEPRCLVFYGENMRLKRVK